MGPCGAGKSTLVQNLQPQGYTIRHIAQEHSYVPDMWQRIAHPDFLVFLDASFPVATARRKLDWTPADYQEQCRRLQHAREHADLFIQTDAMSPADIARRVIDAVNLRA